MKKSDSFWFAASEIGRSRLGMTRTPPTSRGSSVLSARAGAGSIRRMRAMLLMRGPSFGDGTWKAAHGADLVPLAVLVGDLQRVRAGRDREAALEHDVAELQRLRLLE